MTKTKLVMIAVTKLGSGIYTKTKHTSGVCVCYKTDENLVSRFITISDLDGGRPIRADMIMFDSADCVVVDNTISEVTVTEGLVEERKQLLGLAAENDCREMIYKDGFISEAIKLSERLRGEQARRIGETQDQHMQRVHMANLRVKRAEELKGNHLTIKRIRDIVRRERVEVNALRGLLGDSDIHSEKMVTLCAFESELENCASILKPFYSIRIYNCIVTSCHVAFSTDDNGHLRGIIEGGRYRREVRNSEDNGVYKLVRCDVVYDKVELVVRKVFPFDIKEKGWEEILLSKGKLDR